MNGVGVTQIQKYLCECHDHLKETSIHNILLYLKKLYCFLKDTGYSDHDYKVLLSMKICRKSKVLPAATPEDVNAILNVLDMSSVTGKRDYAIILLGWVVGLRAIDIIRLKLTDIDWKKGEIRVLQRKTSVPVILPLTKDVGEALQDYILNGRPNCDYQEIFLRIRPPFRPFKDAVCIGDQYDVYCYRAGIKRVPFDGKGFHSLRRAVGKNMVTSGVSVNTVSQVLGHTAMNSAKKYISLDSKNLKECALDFSGIEVAE
ncbi:MAG: site-specific integrase [Lachnospiraceae bacterium]|nr:site-specific integrase [Lachnospiraceae bacterium]